MKIENYEGTADTFTFPTPANSFDDQGESNSQVTETAFKPLHTHTGGGGIRPKSIILQGHLFGSSRAANYRELTKHFLFEDFKLKKLYFEDDKFYLGYGVGCRKSNSGERVGFIDYVATFRQICPVLFGNTQKTANSSTSQTNAGNWYTYVEEVSGTYDGSGDVVISDSYGQILTIPASILSLNDTVKIKFVTMINTGDFAKYTYYNYLEVNGSETNGLKAYFGLGGLKISEGGNNSEISISNLNSWEIKFRDGYTA